MKHTVLAAKYVRRKLRRVYRRSQTAVLTAMLLVSMLTGFVPVSQAYAAANPSQLQQRSVQLSNSTASAAGVTYHARFIVSSDVTLRTIVVDFCSNSPLVGNDCTAPSGFTIGSAPVISNVLLNGSADSGTWSATSLNGGRTLQYVRDSSVTVTNSGTVSFDIVGVTNPSVADTYYGRVLLYDTALAPAGSVEAWQVTTSLTAGRDRFSAVASNGYLYVMGGEDGTGPLNSVQYAKINADGTIGSWSGTSSFTTARDNFSAVAFNGYLYITGGYNYSIGSLNDVQYAKINADGTIGAWQATSSFPTARQDFSAVASNGYLYVMGGAGGGYLNDVQYAKINADGTIGAWQATSSFPTARQDFSAVASNGYLYVMGGGNGSLLSDTQYAKINADGTIGSWASTVNLPAGRYGFGAVASNGYLYVMGGNGSSGYLNDVQYALINADGTVGNWQATASFANKRYVFSAVASNGYLYVMGGIGSSGRLSDVQYTSIVTSAPSYTDTSPGSYAAYGAVALSTAPAINITALVMETLEFCVYHTTCGDSPAVTLGHGSPQVLDSSAVDTGGAAFSLSTNAGNGVVVTAMGNPPTSGGNTIPAVNGGAAAGGAITAGTAAFGLAVSIPGSLTIPAAYQGDGTPAGHYAFDTTSVPNLTSAYGQRLGNSTGALDHSVSTVTFAATTSPTTPAGVYTMDLRLVATGTF